MSKYPVNAPCPCGSGKKYKRCCGDPKQEIVGRTRRWNPKALVAYTDETGNSGNHLFDAQQPYFWTGTLLCENDLQNVLAQDHADCLRIVGRQELHGNELGLGAIEKIAARLVRIFDQHECKFFFTAVEKEHLAATKFADTVLDSGNNEAVGLLHYGVRALRIPLALQLIQLLDEQDYRHFWTVFTTNDAEGFVALLVRLRERLKILHQRGIYHDRTVELLDDALAWGTRHPAELLERGAYPLDSPNIVAFTLIIDQFHDVNQATGARVNTFIHDEQNQFAKFLKQSYDLLKGFAFEASWLTPIPNVKRMPTFACDMKMEKSSACIGLQLIDVALWIIKRDMLGSEPLRGQCKMLAEYILQNGSISPFTRSAMIMEAEGLIEKTSKLPLPPEKLANARRLQAEIEAARVARMQASEAKPLDRD